MRESQAVLLFVASKASPMIYIPAQSRQWKLTSKEAVVDGEQLGVKESQLLRGLLLMVSQSLVHIYRCRFIPV
jgi:hypothetical protein